MTGIRLVRLNATALVWAEGVLDGARRPELDEVLSDGLDGGAVAVVVDLAAVTRVDETAVTALAAAAGRLGQRGGRVHLLLPGSYRATVVDAAAMRRVLSRLFPQPGQAAA